MHHRSMTLSEISEALEAARKRIFELESMVGVQSGEQFLQAVVDTIEAPIFVKDHNFRYVFVNHCAADVLGLERADMIGKTVSELFPHDQAELIREKDENVLNTGKSSVSEYGVTWKGEPRTILTTKSLFIDKATARRYVVGSAMDITERKLMEETARMNEQRLSSLVRNIPVMISAYGDNGAPVYWNTECERVLGYESDSVVGNDKVLEMLFPDKSQQDEVVSGRNSCDSNVRGVERVTTHADGSERIVSWTKASCISPVSGWASWEVGVDVTEQRKAEEAERIAVENYRTIFEKAPLGIFQATPNGRYLRANKAHAAMLGYDSPESLMQEVQDIGEQIFVNPKEREELKLRLDEYGELRDYQFQARRRDGALIWLARDVVAVLGENGKVQHYEGFDRDVSRRKRMEDQLRHMALHDHLTGLPNRTLCVDRIGRAIQRTRRRDDYTYSVLLIGLDRFKSVNDSFGHDVGDLVLQEVAVRIQSSVRELDTVSRFGGDEFIVLLEEIETCRMPIQIMRRIMSRLAEPFLAGEQNIQLSASVGIVLWTPDFRTPEEVLRNATIAMYRAREKGGGRFCSFSPGLLKEAMDLLSLEHDMDQALAEGQFFMVYQPIVHLREGDGLYGFEALMRWNHPTRGLVMPGEFIAVAEDTGKIKELGMVALEQACSTMSRWREMIPGSRDLMMSVNVSAIQLTGRDFVGDVTRILNKTGMPATCLNLEITETTLMEGGSTAISRLRELADAGISFSVDDFGTGYSSMSYLSRLPLDNMKIDLSFVRMMDVNPDNIEIIRAIIQLAHGLGLKVVAEGVEKVQHREALMAMGCEYYQGFLYSKPVSEEQALDMVTASV